MVSLRFPRIAHRSGHVPDEMNAESADPRILEPRGLFRRRHRSRVESRSVVDDVDQQGVAVASEPDLDRARPAITDAMLENVGEGFVDADLDGAPGGLTDRIGLECRYEPLHQPVEFRPLVGERQTEPG